MPNIYTRDVRIVNTQRWIFDGFLMASRGIEAWGTVELLQPPENKGLGYLMGI